jgi:hypothetical protein
MLARCGSVQRRGLSAQLEAIATGQPGLLPARVVMDTASFGPAVVIVDHASTAT